MSKPSSLSPIPPLSWLALLAGLGLGTDAAAQMRITEYQYSGNDGEFIELTNLGASAVDMTGWTFADSAADPAAGTDLGAFGVVAPGESVILTEEAAEDFRGAWSLDPAVKIIGGLTQNLSRNDEINLYDASDALVDRLTYGDEDFPGTIRTQNASGIPTPPALGQNDIAGWVLSQIGDAEGSVASSGGDIGSPGSTTAEIPRGVIRITEFMYSGDNGEFIELTNIGGESVDLSGWSYDDDSRVPGTFDLSAFGVVQPGESVILTESDAEAFRAAWGLCSATKILGGYTNNIGGEDEINIFDATDTLVDRITYTDPDGDPDIPTQDRGVYPGPGGIDADAIVNDFSLWQNASLGDGEDSFGTQAGEIASPGISSQATVEFVSCLGGQIALTEFNPSGEDGEWVELTNVGEGPISLLNWRFRDGETNGNVTDLSAFGVVQPGESVILTDRPTAEFRTAWSLCAGQRVLANLATGLGRADSLVVVNAIGLEVDRLDYDSADFPLGLDPAGAWVTEAGLLANDASLWTEASIGDVEASYTSAQGDIGNPGASERAIAEFDACIGAPGVPRITVDQVSVAPYLDLDVNGAGAASAAIADPTDPAATRGIVFDFADDDGSVDALTIEAISTNTAVVPDKFLQFSGTGDSRRLRIYAAGAGYTTIVVSATDADGNVGTYAINLAASAPSIRPEATRFHTAASDASSATAIDADYMFVADDENQGLRLYRRDQSGLPGYVADFTDMLALPDDDEVDLESSTRIGDRLFWAGSHGNASDGDARPTSRRLYATDLSGQGADATLAYAGRYDFLAEDLIAWDAADGHGLGANALGFAAGAQEGVPPTIAEGFSVEGLAVAPDGVGAYIAFRAPVIDGDALIVPIEALDALVTGAAPDSLPQGSATFGAPIFLDLQGRSIRSLERNEAGDYLILTGPPGDGSGEAPNDFRLYRWSGSADDAPVAYGNDLNDLLVGGSFESIVEVPADLDAATAVQLLVDNGDFVFYNDGEAAKDLEEPRFRKFRSERIDLVAPVDPDLIFGDGFED